MRRSCGLLLFFALATALRADLTGADNAPSYTPQSVVNAATQKATPLAPNTIATIYGTNLSWQTYAITPADLNGGMLPRIVQGVEVVVGGVDANIFYVSPTQINFLIPYELIAGQTTMYVLRQGVQGPAVPVTVDNTSPGFFEWDGNLAVAEHADGSLISPASPASAGEIIVLYAAGLGHTLPDTQSGRIAESAAQIVLLPALQVLLNGVPCPASSILYAGLTPGFSGLYQINLQLPASIAPNPLIQIVVGEDQSPASVQLPLQ